MSQQKLNKRQKMINLLYIILLAILAISVSEYSLNGIGIIYTNMQKSNEQLIKANEILFQEIETKQLPYDTLTFYKARKTQELEKNMVAEIDHMKSEIIRAAGSASDDVEMFNKNDTKTIERVMIKQKNAEKLKQLLDQYSQDILGVIESPVQKELVSIFVNPTAADYTTASEWAEYSFKEHTVMSGLSLLLEIEKGVVLSANIAYQEFLYTIKKELEALELEPYAIASASNIAVGDTLKIHTGLRVARRDNSDLNVVVEGVEHALTENGDIEIQPQEVGIKQINGYVTHTTKTSTSTKSKKYPFNLSYTVTDELVELTPISNIVYAGLETALAINTYNISFDEIILKTDQGVLTQKDDTWYITANDKSSIVISVYRKLNNQLKLISEHTLNVTQLPSPTAYVNYKDKAGESSIYRGGAPINMDDFMNSIHVAASLVHDNKVIEYKVSGFEVVIVNNDKTVSPQQVSIQGDRFTEEALSAIKNASGNDKVYITSIVVNGLGCTNKEIAPINVILNEK